jgi:hypothetical protein
VLKITAIPGAEKSLKIMLCGQFTEEYVRELEKTFAAEQAADQNIELDLCHVTFVDRAAMVFLCAATARKISIKNCPSYVSRWIQQERRCAPPPQE